MKLIIFGMASALCLFGPGLAAAASDPAGTASDPAGATTVAPLEVPAKSAKGGPDEVVCKREESTGSLLGGKKTCMTKAQWDDQARDAHAAAAHIQRNVLVPVAH